MINEEALWAEERAEPWWDPLNEEWMNRYTEKGEWELREKYINAGNLKGYEDGETLLMGEKR